MKAFVTGGAGYIGSHTCKILAGQGHEVTVYDNLSTGHREFVKWGAFEHGDILDTQHLRACLRRHKPDCVVHFAAKSCVGESVENPGMYFRNNVSGTLSLLEAMRDEGVRGIVVSGTCSVYGQPEEMPISESCPVNPINPYGRAKLFMERMLEDFETAHGFKWMSLRYFNAAGNDPDGELYEWHEPETHLLPRVAMAAAGRIPALEIFGDDYPTPDGTCIRDYVHVNDIASAHVLAMRHLDQGRPSMALNLGSGTGYSIKEILTGFEALYGRRVPHRYAARRAGDPAVLVANPALAQQALQWRCAFRELTAILRTTMRPEAAG